MNEQQQVRKARTAGLDCLYAARNDDLATFSTFGSLENCVPTSWRWTTFSFFVCSCKDGDGSFPPQSIRDFDFFEGLEDYRDCDSSDGIVGEIMWTTLSGG